jgi:hypothetical protein
LPTATKSQQFLNYSGYTDADSFLQGDYMYDKTQISLEAHLSPIPEGDFKVAIAVSASVMCFCLPGWKDEYRGFVGYGFS